MNRTRHLPVQVIRKLRTAEQLLNQGQTANVKQNPGDNGTDQELLAGLLVLNGYLRILREARASRP
jgi:hypothetical protein